MDKEKQIKAKAFDNTLSDDDYKYLKELEEKFLNDFDPEDESTKFTEQDYANLQHNLVLFKQGDREAGEYIVAAFHRVIHAYAHFIVLHKIPYKMVTSKSGNKVPQINPSIMSFIRLFTKISKNKDTSEFKDGCEYIYSLFKKFEYGDIYNELVLALLNMANKYKIITDPNDPKYKPNGTFHLYVKKCFHFEAFNFLKQLIKDPLMNINILSLSDDEDTECDDPNVVKMSMMVDEKALLKFNTVIDYIDRQIALTETDKLTLKEDEDLDIYSDDALNFNWVNGTVCGPIFKSLTSYERELLVLAYVKNQTEDTLATLYGLSRASIGSHKRKAIAKLKRAMEENKHKGGQ